MKKNGLIFGILEILLAIFACFCIFMMIQSRAVPARKKIAVIVEDSENDIWTPLRNGADEAGKEQNVDIRFVTTGTFDDEKDEIRAIDDAISDGCDGILVCPVDEKAVSLIRKKSYKIPVLLLIADTKYDMKSISVDAEEAGRKIAEMIVKDNGSGRSIGIVVDRRNSRITRQMKNGLDAGLKDYDYEEAFLRKGANESFIRYSRPDVLVCFDEEALSMSANLIAANKLAGVKVYGCGFAPKDVYQLDMENIRGLVYPDVFRIGYYGVNEMASRIKGNLSQPRSRVVESRALRKRDIFSNDSVLNTFSRK